MSDPHPRSTLLVTGLHPETREPVLRLVWHHGDTLEELLARHGRAPADLDGVAGRRTPHEVELRVVLHPIGAHPTADRLASLAPGPQRVPHDPDLQLAAGEEPHRVQRIAVYAVVRSARGVLLTAYSDRTNAPGWIGWPGGGLDLGELPQEGLRREVREETGQEIEIGEVLAVRSSRWIGRAPDGRLEDFQTVRIVYLADCPNPTDPVVHDVGGTTAYAVWSPPAEVADLPLTTTCRAIWADYLAGRA